jgi:poly-D-alanine transfer protein DltD
MNQYSKLEEMVLYMKSKKIKFIYVQAPIKKSLTDKNDSNKIILGHFSKCKSIVEGNGGYYINLHNTDIYDDSLFIDQYHLTGTGSKIYTKQIVEKLGKILN